MIAMSFILPDTRFSTLTSLAQPVPADGKIFSRPGSILSKRPVVPPAEGLPDKSMSADGVNLGLARALMRAVRLVSVRRDHC